MGIDVDEEIIFVTLRLPRGMREDVARVGLHGDFLQFTELRRSSLQHRRISHTFCRSVTQAGKTVQPKSDRCSAAILVVIPGRRAAASPESITTTGRMDSEPALSVHPGMIATC